MKTIFRKFVFEKCERNDREKLRDRKGEGQQTYCRQSSTYIKKENKAVL